ncbi:MAG: YCF48-related protein [Steroidobacteraceae bacterium]
MQPAARSRTRVGTLAFLGVAFVLVILGAWYTDVHRPLPNALEPVTGLRWWFTPVERNAFMRMPVIEGNLHALDASADGRVVWAVGEQGLIIGTRDGGRTWMRGTVLVGDAQPLDARATPASKLKAWNFIGSAYAGEPPPYSSQPSAQSPVQSPIQSPIQSQVPSKEDYSNSKMPVTAPNAPAELTKEAVQSKELTDSKAPPIGKQPAPSPRTTVRAKAPEVKTKAPETPAPPKANPSPPVQEPPFDLTRAALYGVQVLDEKRAVAVGERGLVLFTIDGGETWRPRKTPVSETLVAVNIDGGDGIAVGKSGIAISTQDAGETWSTIGLSAGPFVALAPLSAGQWLVVGTEAIETVRAVPSRSGRSTIEYADATTRDLRAIAVRNADMIVGVGRNGRILSTSDAGRTWTPIVFDAGNERSPTLSAARFTSDGRLIVASASGALYVTADGGKQWQRTRAGGADTAVTSLVSTATALYGAGAGGTLLRSTDGGEHWEPLAISHGTFTDLRMIDAARGVILGGANLVLSTDDAGSRWGVRSDAPVLDDPPKIASAGAVEFFDERQGLKINSSGALVRTSNAGRTWTPVVVPTRAPLIDVAFASADRAVLLALGRVLISKDAGATFRAVKYLRYPSPWIWVATVLLIAAAGVAVHRHLRAPAVERQPSSITDAAASDRPIGWKDPDPAGLRDIALGLSRFMRNRRTEPPLTIAVTGEWGTGKSSLMNLLRHDLSRYGYRPVWFNAWHHQSGENLLGSLLANIHAQGVPAWHTLSGVDFRATLLLIRARRFWWRLAITLFLLAVIFFSYRTLGANASKLWESLTSATDKSFSNIGAATGLLGLIVAILTPILGAVRAVSAFGLQPGKLIAAVATTRNDESARLQAGARYRFAREFEDFTRALDPRPLVIFIDDLDRCRAENVIEVLEAVNFLVTSGRCIVVIGMARRWVETCVGLAFKDLAAAQIEMPVPQDRDGALTEQQVFARNYLEKLINVELRVPRLSDSAACALLQGTEPERDEPAPRRAVGRALAWLAPQLLMVVVVGCVIFLGAKTADWLKDLDAQAQLRERAVAEASVAASNPLPTATATPITPPATVIAGSSRPVAFDTPNAKTSWNWYVGTCGALLSALAGLGLLALFARKEARTDDSPAFRDALAILQPWIVLGGSSPRSLKRFVNHVRYIAMRFRADPQFLSVVERALVRVRHWFGVRERNEASSDAMPRVQLSEELLVAFATLHRCNEHWLDELFLARTAKLESLAEHLLIERFDQPAERTAVVTRLTACIADFNRRFPESALFASELLDRRHAIAFYEAMAIDAGARDQTVPDEVASAPTPLRPAG